MGNSESSGRTIHNNIQRFSIRQLNIIGIMSNEWWMFYFCSKVIRRYKVIPSDDLLKMINRLWCPWCMMFTSAQYASCKDYKDFLLKDNAIMSIQSLINKMSEGRGLEGLYRFMFIFYLLLQTMFNKYCYSWTILIIRKFTTTQYTIILVSP